MRINELKQTALEGDICIKCGELFEVVDVKGEMNLSCGCNGENKMGQRSQVVISLPPIYYNETNPNNKPRRLHILHNQWLYGFRFLKFAEDMIWAIEETLEEESKNNDANESYRTVSEREINRCIAWANYNDFYRVTNTHQIDGEDGKDYMPELSAQVPTNDGAMLEHISNVTDNNNGYIFIHISDDYKVTFQLFNGLEDAPELESKTPEQYLKLFYDDKQLKSLKSDKRNDSVFQAFENLKDRESQRTNVLELIRKDCKTYVFNKI
jgi:hypothetical protein